MSNPRCNFHVRYPEGEGWRYETAFLETPTNYLVTAHPPAVGDIILLRGNTEETRGVFEVVARAWSHAAWGSQVWPRIEDESTVGPILDIIVEPSEGVFIDEVDRTAAGGSSSVEDEEVHDGA